VLTTAGTVTLAERIASPVLDCATDPPTRGIVRGVGRAAAYLDFDGFVVVVTAHATPLMPNGIRLRGAFSDWQCPPRGTPIALEPGRLAAGPGSVVWRADRPPSWEPRLAKARSSGREQLSRRGAEILAACGIHRHRPDPEALAGAFVTRGIGRHSASRDGIERLLRSVESRDPDDAGAAAEWLIGRGPGLTPEGDDLLAATAGVIAAFGAEAGWSAGELGGWLDAIVPVGLRSRTTALSATLIELAAAAQVVEPLHHVLCLQVDGRERWRSGLGRLLDVGGSTGLAYAAAAGAAASLCHRPLTTTKETDARP
jgi:hypothetical protein